jgi:hypothetical protein
MLLPAGCSGWKEGIAEARKGQAPSTSAYRRDLSWIYL